MNRAVDDVCPGVSTRDGCWGNVEDAPGCGDELAGRTALEEWRIRKKETERLTPRVLRFDPRFSLETANGSGTDFAAVARARTDVDARGWDSGNV